MSDRTFQNERDFGTGGSVLREEVHARPFGSHVAFAAAVTLVSLFFILREWLAIRSGAVTPHDFAALWLTLGAVSSVLVGALVLLLFAIHGSARSLAAGMTQDLRLSTDWLERLFDYAPVPYLLLDAAGIVTEANKAAVRLFAVSSAEALVGKRIVELAAQSAAQDIEQYVAYFINGAAVTGKEFPIKSDGEERWVLFSLEILGERGERQRGIATLIDISERRALELAKTEFVSVAAHQLRTPLSNMSWQSEMLLSADAGALTAEQRTRAEKVYDGVRHLAEVVDLLLSAARLETGTLTASFERVDLPTLAARALAALEQMVAVKRLTVETFYDERLRAFTTDSRLVDTVVSNLLSNAVKYTPDGGRVVFSVEAFENDGARIRVRDSGAGIPAEALPFIFTKLFRAENARQVDAKGLGLGLYIVRKIVDLLDGTISFTSEEGKGTEFVVSIPVGRLGG